MWKSFLAILFFTTHLYGGEVDLVLNASLAKKEVVRYEPVVMKIEVENVSEKPQTIYHPVAPELKIFLVDPDGKTHELPFSLLDAAKAKERGNPDSMTLSSEIGGRCVHRRIVLKPFPGNWLDKPGKYTLAATFKPSENEKEPLSSRLVELTVKKPEGVDERALERFRGYPQAKYFAGQSACPDIGSEFETIIQQYPESVYAPWCYYALGKVAQYDPSMTEGGRSREATMLFKSLLKRHPEFPLKVEIEYEIERELIRLGKPEEAYYGIKKLAEVDPDGGTPNAELFLFYEARRVLGFVGDDKKRIDYHVLPSHR